MAIYTIPLPSVAESNETLIAKQVIRVLDCSSNIDETNLCNQWNENRCSTDTVYCNPFLVGDVIVQQYTYNSSKMSNVFIRVFDSDTEEMITDGVTIETGNDIKGQSYINVVVDTTNWIGIKCFYYKLTAFKCKLRGEDLENYNACVEDLIIQEVEESEAQQTCLMANCEDASIIHLYSQPFCNAECRKTILVEGHYPQYDCNGNYYADFVNPSGGSPVPNSFSPKIRLYGEVMPTNFEIEETLYNSKRKSAKRLLTFTLKTHKIPFYVAEKLSIIFASQFIFVDGVEYIKALNFSKDNEDGTMWIVTTTLLQECDEINFTCE